MAKRLCVLLLPLLLAGCVTAPGAFVPTPWGVVGVKSFDAATESVPETSPQLAVIEAHRHDGLVSSAAFDGEPALASR